MKSYFCKEMMIMGLLHHDVTVLDFDHVYEQQPALTERADAWIDLSITSE